MRKILLVLALGAIVLSLGGCAAVPGEIRVRDIPVTTIDGKAGTLAAYRGRTTLLHFWATWCATCREELGSLSRVATAVPELAVVAIAIEDEPVAVRRFVESTNISFPVLLDRGEARVVFAIPSVPYTILLDSTGHPRTFLDPESGEWVSAISAPRSWDNTVAIERVKKSVRYRGVTANPPNED